MCGSQSVFLMAWNRGKGHVRLRGISIQNPRLWKHLNDAAQEAADKAVHRAGIEWMKRHPQWRQEFGSAVRP